MFLYYKNKARGVIFEEKRDKRAIFLNYESNNDPTESNTINQSNTKSS